MGVLLPPEGVTANGQKQYDLRCRATPVGTWNVNAMWTCPHCREILDEHLPDRCWVLTQAIGGVKVQVWWRDFERAQSVLEEAPSPLFRRLAGSVPGPICPRCGSADLYAQRYWQRGVFLSWPILGFPLPLRWSSFCCSDCGYGEDPPFSIPAWFTLRRMLILILVAALLLSLAKTFDFGWFVAISKAISPGP